MNISEINLIKENKGGDPTKTATITRKHGDEYIKVVMIDGDNVLTHHVLPDCQEDVFSMAGCLQYYLDGYEGTNSEIHDYYRILENFMD
ncbi:MAG: hypothetical protein JEZ07_08855 [Phycisphaerae bacterium]|nr:hypothetical protein [Phycisphaerae bacterium]